MYVGTSGWQYSHWKGIFYPEELKSKDWLRFYAQHLNTLELNVTFYRQVRRSTFQKWYNTVPVHFLFSAKMSRFITHINRLKVEKESVIRFLAAHMFIFYYALLSEVSPPTALSPFAAAAITGGDPYKTTMMAWKYAITAFLLPFIFTVLPAGRVLLLRWEGIGVIEGIWTIIAAFLGIGVLAAGCSGWLLKKATIIERVLLVVGALMFVYPNRLSDVLGFACLIVVVLLQKMRKDASDAGITRDAAT